MYVSKTHKQWYSHCADPNDSIWVANSNTPNMFTYIYNEISRLSCIYTHNEMRYIYFVKLQLMIALK